jgi:hypothetical protein
MTWRPAERRGMYVLPLAVRPSTRGSHVCRSNRSPVSRTYSGFSSIPSQSRPCWRATSATVPLPMNGSSTRPGRVGAPQPQGMSDRGRGLPSANRTGPPSRRQGRPQPVQTFSGQVARIGRRISSGGKLAPCPLTRAPAIRQASPGFFPSGCPRSPSRLRRVRPLWPWSRAPWQARRSGVGLGFGASPLATGSRIASTPRFA